MLNVSNAFIGKVYADVRQFKGRVTITMDAFGVNNPRIYDNETIVKMNILEEISTLNETLPSNELQLTMDNSTGDFDVLTYANMNSILASKPSIFCELGLVYPIPVTSGLVNSNFEDFPLTTIATDWTLYGTGVTLAKDTGFTGNGQKITVTNGNNGGVNSGYDVKAVPVGATLYVRFLYKGTRPNYNYIMSASGNKVLPALTVTSIDGTWFEAKTSVVTSWATPVDAGIIICLDQRTAGISGTTTIDDVYVSTSPYGSEQDFTEWLPMGKYFITEWKNDITTRIITFTANDYFRIFGDTNYEPVEITNLFDLAQDVLNKAGVPAADQIISPHLNEITVNSFKERLDSRTALQHIGIAARSTVFQDRNGKVNIEPFLSLEKSSNYILYTRSQPSLYGYAGGSTYSRVSTSGGMTYIDVDNMYDFPEVTLDRSVYQVAIKVYDYTLDPEAEPAEIVYTQGLQGSNGISFSIDNPLVNTVELAQEIVDWFFRESNYNAVYKLNWRQNPALECVDVVLIEDAFQANKQTRIYRQEFLYEGYLEGSTESRGGF